jgi:hypothetical protein
LQLFRLTKEGLTAELAHIGLRDSLEGVNGTLGGSAGGKPEMLLPPIPEPDIPHNVTAFIMGLHLSPQGHKVGVAPNMNSVGGAQLDAGIALGAQLWLLVEPLIGLGVQNH